MQQFLVLSGKTEGKGQGDTGAQIGKDKNFLKTFVLCASVPLWLICFAGPAAAQTPPSSSPQAGIGAATGASPGRKGSTEWGWTSGGGARIAGGAREGNFWAAQLRWGRVLTAPHGPGVLRGTLEYAFEVVPAFVMVQSETVFSRTIFGGGVNPLLLQYNFTRGRRFVPFLQAGGGMLFTTQDIPAGTAQFNFTPQGGMGVYWLRREHSSVALGVRYHHISNAGRIRPNPGHNALYFYTGISWWR